MTYRLIITLVATLFTTETFSSKCELKEWDLNDTPLPPSTLIQFLERETSLLESPTPSSNMTYDKALRLLKHYKLGFSWGDGRFYGEPHKAFFQVFEFNFSSTLFWTKSLEATSELILEKSKALSELQKRLETEPTRRQHDHTQRAITRHELKLTGLYTSQAKEIETFKEDSVCRLGELIAQAEKKKARAARRESHSADHPIVPPLNKPPEHLKKDL